MIDNYSDIINLEHPTSKRHPRMSLESRSAQFAPFAALTGYSDAVIEKARLTNKKIEMDNESKLILSTKLQKINEQVKQRPTVSVTYFVKDKKKEGGQYLNIKDKVKRIDDVYKLIYLEHNKINIEDILDIDLLT